MCAVCRKLAAMALRLEAMCRESGAMLLPEQALCVAAEAVAEN